jgi:hypothetical protein
VNPLIQQRLARVAATVAQLERMRIVADGCMCPQNAAPVCGTDGRTYENACVCRCSGADVMHDGPCEKKEESNIDDGAAPAPTGKPVNHSRYMVEPGNGEATVDFLRFTAKRK